MKDFNRQLKQSEDEIRKLERIDRIFTVLIAILFCAVVAFAIISKIAGAW